MPGLNLESLLGKRLNDPEVHAFLAQFGEKAETTDFVDQKGYFVSFRRSGIVFGVDGDFVVKTIFLYSQGKDGFGEFREMLPNGLSFRDSADAVHNKLGTPSLSGGGQQDEYFGFVPFHDRYDLIDNVLHIEYKKDRRSLALITIMMHEGNRSGVRSN